MAKEKRAGVGFFHPSQPIKEKLQALYAKAEIDGVLVVGKEKHRINHKEQTAYECRINGFDEWNIFKIVCSNFKLSKKVPPPSQTKSWSRPPPSLEIPTLTSVGTIIMTERCCPREHSTPFC